MRAPPAGEIKARALSALGPSGDERAQALLERAEVVLVPGVSRWEGSSGDMLAHRLLVGTDARSLGLLAAHPAVEDALVEALGAAFSTYPGHALGEVVFHWAIDEPSGEEGYRGEVVRAVDPRDGTGLRAALVAYLEAEGQAKAAGEAAHLSLRPAPFDRAFAVRVRAPRGRGLWAKALVTRALEALLGGPDRLPVRVEYEAG